MSEELSPLTDHKQVMESFIEPDKIVQRLSSLYPDDHYAWTGSIDEKLEYLMGKLLKNYLYVRDHKVTPPRGQTKESVELDDHAFTSTNGDIKPQISEGIPLDISWAFTKVPDDIPSLLGRIEAVDTAYSPLGSDHPPF